MKRKPIFVISVFFFLSGIIAATWSSRIPSVQQFFAFNDAQWGTILFAAPAGSMVSLLVSGWLVEKFGSRFIMVSMGILYFLSLTAIAYSTTTIQLVSCLFMFGVFRNLFNLANNTHSIEVQASFNKPIVSRLHGIWSVSCIIAALIGTIMLANHVATTIHFVVIAMSSFIVLLFFAGYGRIHQKPHTQSRFFVKPGKKLLLLGMVTFCTMLTEGAMFDWSVNYFEQVIKASKSTITLGYTCFIVSMSLGRLFGDKIIARVGALKLLMWNGVLMCSGFLMAAAFPNLLPACIAFLMIGAGDAIIIPMVYSLAGQSRSMPASYAISTVTFIGYFGFLFGPVVIGFISHMAGMRWAFVLLSLVSLIITALALSLRKQNETTA